MNVKALTIPEVLLIEHKLYKDQRGFNYESFNVNDFEKITKEKQAFVQDNFSQSVKGVLRGLHYQLPPYTQSKLVRVIKGSVLDVAVDMRKNSSTFGQHVAIELTEQNKYQLFVPRGFAHGFVALEDDTIFTYKCTKMYNKESEGSLLWKDKDLNINWKIQEPIVSEKDQSSQSFVNFVSEF